MLIVSTFVLQIFFFAPLQVLSQNFGQFSVQFVDILMIHLVLSFTLIVLLYLAVRLLKLPIFPAALTFLSLVAFLESRFFLVLARHNPFDGKPIEWEPLQALSYIELGIILVLGVFFAAFRRRTQLLSTVSLFILFFLTVGFFHTTISNIGTLIPNESAMRGDSIYFDQFYRLSGQRNIIHIVPDQTQGVMLHDILASDYEHYSEVFDGFTLFTQAVGRYESIYPSVLFYMAGEAPEPEHDLVLNQPYTWEYIEETLTERSIISLLSQNDFKTFGFQFHPGIFCKGPYTACTGTHEEVFGGVDIKTPKRKLALTVLTVLDIGFFQMTPIVMRERVYDKGHWSARKLLRGTMTHSGILDIFTAKLKVDEGPGTYNYFHHAGVHAPLLFNRNCSFIGPQAISWENQREQVICTLKQLEKMIRSLKNQRVYDQTMIVINSDHGMPWIPPHFPTRSGTVMSSTLMGVASSLLLVKPPEMRGPLVFSDQPVTTGDIPATIADAFGLEGTFPGVQIFSAELDADRERAFYTYESPSKAHNLQALPNLTRYRIRGNVFNELDWILPNTSNSGEFPSQLRMDHAEFLAYTQGFSDLEQHDTPMRWVDGTQARVYLFPPSQGSLALVIDSFVPESIKGQSIQISVEGRVIAKLDETQLQERRHIIPVPDDLARAEVIEIEFRMGKSFSTGNDERRLSVLFSYIGLEPTG